MLGYGKSCVNQASPPWLPMRCTLLATDAHAALSASAAPPLSKSTSRKRARSSPSNAATVALHLMKSRRPPPVSFLSLASADMATLLFSLARVGGLAPRRDREQLPGLRVGGALHQLVGERHVVGLRRLAEQARDAVERERAVRGDEHDVRAARALADVGEDLGRGRGEDVVLLGQRRRRRDDHLRHAAREDGDAERLLAD